MDIACCQLERMYWVHPFNCFLQVGVLVFLCSVQENHSNSSHFAGKSQDLLRFGHKTVSCQKYYDFSPQSG